ncbi:MAG TPA: hypothetical protein PK264_08975 [Hyphomicrobiaceae bacterium]|nr:hypothetical protein [Hyphomicrobiaceae bacterium]
MSTPADSRGAPLPASSGTSSDPFASPRLRATSEERRQRRAALFVPELVLDTSSDNLVRQVRSLISSVEAALSASSKPYRLLKQIEDAGLSECARCTAELRNALERNHHFVTLIRLRDLEAALQRLDAA